jgi:hypothetical protein
MPKLSFKTADFLPIHEHAKGSSDFRLSFSDLADKSLLKAGETMPKRGWAEESQIDKSKIGPRILLVKDQGCYLMSAGIPALTGTGTANAVAYAEGLGPDCDYEDLRCACGGDDFAEPLPLSMFDQAMKSGAKTVFVHLNKTTIRVSWK